MATVAPLDAFDPVLAWTPAAAETPIQHIQQPTLTQKSIGRRPILSTNKLPMAEIMTWTAFMATNRFACVISSVTPAVSRTPLKKYETTPNKLSQYFYLLTRLYENYAETYHCQPIGQRGQ